MTSNYEAWAEGWRAGLKFINARLNHWEIGDRHEEFKNPYDPDEKTVAERVVEELDKIERSSSYDQG